MVRARELHGIEQFRDQPEAVLGQYGGQSFSVFKKALTELAVTKLSPITTEAARLAADPAEIDRVLADGSARARTLAEPVMREVKDIVGFVHS